MSLHFAHLHPDADDTSHSIEMQADVIKILLAALRGHDDFYPNPLALHHSETGLPTLLNEFLEVCRTIQMLDACLRSGRLKYKGGEPV